MILKSSGELIGDCGLTRQIVDGADEIEIGYHVRRDLWGRWLCSRGGPSLSDYGFTRLGVDHLISLIRPENLPSRRVAEKTGLTLWKEVMWRDVPHCVYVIRRWRSIGTPDSSRCFNAGSRAVKMRRPSGRLNLSTPVVLTENWELRSARAAEGACPYVVLCLHQVVLPSIAVGPPFQDAWNCFCTKPAS